MMRLHPHAITEEPLISSFFLKALSIADLMSMFHSPRASQYSEPRNPWEVEMPRTSSWASSRLEIGGMVNTTQRPTETCGILDVQGDLICVCVLRRALRDANARSKETFKNPATFHTDVGCWFSGCWLLVVGCCPLVKSRHRYWSVPHHNSTNAFDERVLRAHLSWVTLQIPAAAPHSVPVVKPRFKSGSEKA